jgi:octaprenyl-diphosphate synthase
MSEGEIHQIHRSRKLNIDEESYLRIIADKTASLLSTCCEIGATSATDDPEKARLMREYGENVGMAFQIRDDLLDYVGRASITGKPVGLDVSERKLTLPLIHALRQAPVRERDEMMGMIRKGGKKMDVRRVLEFVRAHGGLDYAAERGRSYARQAAACLSPFPPGPAREAPDAFARFVVERNR